MARVTLDTTKADDIALVIEEAIVSGELAPGTVLRQEQLSEQFNVSRTPVREALRRLAALGLVSFVPNRGVRVRTISRDELHDPRGLELAQRLAHRCPRDAELRRERLLPQPRPRGELPREHPRLDRRREPVDEGCVLLRPRHGRATIARTGSN